jgi:uncharacterized protein YehS (DUF1456 family)
MTLNTNDILYKITKALSLSKQDILDIYKLEDYHMDKSHLDRLLKRKYDKDFVACSYEELGVFLDGLIAFKRGEVKKRPSDDEVVVLDNNLIIKKLRVALNLKEYEIDLIFKLADIELTKQQIKSIFRNPNHKNYKVCSDELLDKFLEGLDEFYYIPNE